MERVPVEDRTRLLSDRGPGYLARALQDYLRMLEIRHIYCSPYHPQTNGKLERFHETLKARPYLLVFSSPEALRAWRSSSNSTTTGVITKGSAM